MMRATDRSTQGPMAPPTAEARSSAGSSTPLPYGCMDRTPWGDGMRMPAEWARPRAHPDGLAGTPELWGDRHDDACAAHADIARAVVAPRAGHDGRRTGRRRGAPGRACGPGSRWSAVPIDDSWMRDIGPDRRRRRRRQPARACDFAFNGWGEKFAPWDRDDAARRARSPSTSASRATRPRSCSRAARSRSTARARS